MNKSVTVISYIESKTQRPSKSDEKSSCFGQCVRMKKREEKKLFVNDHTWFLKRDPDTDTLVRKSSAGGLVTAVAPVVVKSGGLWVRNK